MNKPKNIGTAAESAVVKFMHSIGYDATNALRMTLSGAADVGDVWCHHADGTLVIEVKGGESARSASHGQITAWLAEAVTEADNTRRKLDRRITPVLVLQTRGVGVNRAGDWRAYMRASDYLGLGNADYVISMRLRDLMSEFDVRAA